jgi:hypothetical protein
VGVGIGIGLGKNRPSKGNLLVYFCVNDVITLLILPDEIPPIFLQRPTAPLFCNGIDFSFTSETSCLSISVHFTKLIVTNEAIAPCFAMAMKTPCVALIELREHLLFVHT